MRLGVVAGLVIAGALPALALPPRAPETIAARTLVVGIEVDRDVAHVLGTSLKARPFVRRVDEPLARSYASDEPVQVELVLRGPAAAIPFVRRVDVGPLCLLHPGGEPPHIEGDRIRVHRDSFVVELPELEGFDQLEVAVYDAAGAGMLRRTLGRATLAPESAAPPSSAVPTAATVLWPENFGESPDYVVYGDELEADRRINVVIVPDGYRHDQKALLEAHAAGMVQNFRAKTPYAEHDRFFNYILVYAYSVDAGTDQCDCSIVVNSAMGTRFPLQNPQCGNSDNRCLYYGGGGCDTDGTSNIVAAEMRAPYKDTTIVMVNTERYGGCGGSRAVYSAANSSAQEIAMHELGHSLAGLADEYSSFTGCGSFSNEVNTSKNGAQGAWAEWVSTLGPPRQGADYYTDCLYRPLDNCEMRALNQPFCPVCNQRWSLVTFGHPRIVSTAPIESASPTGSVVSAWTGLAVPFNLTTRLSVGPNVTNAITWKLTGTGIPLPLTVASGVTSHSQTFGQPGSYTLTAQVVADTNFVKPQKNGANMDTVTWNIQVTNPPPPPEISPPGSAFPLRFGSPTALSWQDASSAGVFTYNVYRGSVSTLPGGSYGGCLLQGLTVPATPLGAETPAPGSAWTYLVTGENSVGEGTLGQTSAGAPRPNGTPCP